MYRLFLYWLPHLTQFTLKIVFCIAVSAGLAQVIGIPFIWIVAASVAFSAGAYRHYAIRAIRFARIIRTFRTQASEHVVLRYPPQVEGRLDLRLYFEQANEILAEFTRDFGFPLRRRLVVFLFGTPERICRVFDFGCQSFALPGGDAIGLCADEVGLTRIDESIRHELAHLFSAYWSRLSPAFNDEGLATWLMRSMDGTPIDVCALATVLTDRYVPLTSLASTLWTYSTSNYSVAGSFTGYLLRRFGFDRYAEFFRIARSKTLETSFARTFGLRLSEAERQWRDNLFERRDSFEPHFTQYLGERLVEANYQAGQVYLCLQEVEKASQGGRPSTKVTWYAAAAHFRLGHYSQALSKLEEMICSDDSWGKRIRGAARLQIGNIFDLLGQRDNAIAAYKQTLIEPAYWYGPANTTHHHARCYLSRPFTERNLQSLLSRNLAESR
jgi:hypothetical protein